MENRQCCPKAYRLLAKIFLLPSVSLLRKTMKKVNIYPGVNVQIIQALKTKISTLPTNSNICALVVDEMSLKEEVKYNEERDEIEGLEDFGIGGKTALVANHATVFVARGLLSKWKQPIGYFLSSGPADSEKLKNMIKECLDKLESAGLSCRVLIGDQGSNNRKTFEKLLGASETKPYFYHNEKKVFVMYDPPHLLKNVRNNFKKSGFVVNGTLCRWEHVAMFFKFDKQNPVRMAPRLTETHLSLPQFSKLSVVLAAQVMSHSVAAGISTLVQLKCLPEDARDTALFIERIDRLFNAFNSGSSVSGRSMGHGMTVSSSHKEFLLDTLQWLNSVQTPSSQRLPCIFGWKMDIRVVLELFEDLHTHHSVECLLTNRLNQDCLENLFSVIRGKRGNVDRPSCQQFRHFFRQAMVDSLFIHSSRSNCQDDGDKMLLTLTAVTATSTDSDRQTNGDNSDDEPVNDTDTGITETSEISSHTAAEFSGTQPLPSKDHTQVTAQENVLTYIGGYIARKIMGKTCDQCQKLLTGEPSGAENELLLVNKQYTVFSGHGLIFPSAKLTAVVCSLESAYNENIAALLSENKVKARLLQILKTRILHNELQCEVGACDLTGNIIRLFANVRLHFSLKDSSRSFLQKHEKRNKKLIKLNNA